MTERGVIYICWGAPAVADAQKSMASLWKHAPDMPVFMVGDAEATAHFAGKPLVTAYHLDIDPFRAKEFLAGLVKPRLAALTPFEWSLYVDADTEFQASPDVAFGMLERWDLVVAETETRSLLNSIAGRKETQWTAQWLGTPHLAYHNSGMLIWRRNAATARLFELWSEEWKRFQNWDEQVALLRALLRSEALYLTVPHTWNCREGKRTTFLHHRFGTRSARKLDPRRRPPRPATRRVAHVERGFIRFEFAPGRFVRCKPGDEERMRQLLGNLHKPRNERR